MAQRFDPSTLYPRLSSRASLDWPYGDVEIQGTNGFVHPAHPQLRGVLNGVVVAVDSAYLASSKASFGIFVGPPCHLAGIRFNKARLLHRDYSTPQAAEIVAGIEGVRTAARVACEWPILYGLPLERVIIKTNSMALVWGMTEWIHNWESNGWKNSSGWTVSNQYLWGLLSKELSDLGDLVKPELIHFWHVPSKFNRDADLLANSVL